MSPSPFKRARRALVLATRAEMRAAARRRPVDSRAVFFESFDGNGALCNPEAVFRALAADPEFEQLRFVWSLRSGHETDLVFTQFHDDPRVSFVRPGSPSYARAVSTAGYLVTNATFPRWFSRRPGQTVLNTWHGTPLKKMGFDIDDQPARVANVLRTFLHSDFVLSSGAYMTETMYRRAHRLEGLFDGTVLEAGSPRVDQQFAGPEQLAVTRRALRDAGIDAEGRQLILFAPTWKGTSFLRPLDDALILLDQVATLQYLVGDRYLVALKAHQAVHDSVRGRSGRAPLVPNDLPTNAVLAVTDQLVTDYSSIFFDFLTTKRPIHFFVPDFDDYDGYRGLYVDPASWPGRVTSTLDALAHSLLSQLDADLTTRAEAARLRFAADEDGGATGRVVDAVFRDRPGSVRQVRLDGDGRPRQIAVVGGPPGPFEAAAIDAALARVDLESVDLTILVSDSRRKDFIDWQKGLDHRIRIMVRQGGIEGSKVWTLLERLGGHRPASHWTDEWERIFGRSRVDTVTSLSGDTFWNALAEAGASRLRVG